MDYKKFKKEARREKDAIVPVLFLDPIATPVTFLLKKTFKKLTPTQITISRLVFFSPLVIALLLLAPFFGDIFYLLAGIGFYVTLLTDCMDGQLARGTKAISKKGDLLDCISDRFSNITFFTLLFSFAIRINNMFLLIGSFLILILKIFQMVIVIRISESKFLEKSNPDAYLSERIIVEKIGIDFVYRKFFALIKPLKIKRIDPRRSCFDQYIITIIIPTILIYFQKFQTVTYFLCFLTVFFIVYYLYKIKTIISAILNQTE